MKRVLFTVATGKRAYQEQALGLARSLRLIGDTTHRILMTDAGDGALSRNFDEIIRPPTSASAYMLKLSALACTDADEVLFVDSDSLAFKRLDSIFKVCSAYDFAVQGRMITSGHWYGFAEDYLPRLGFDEIPRFNGGMMFYRRSAETLRLIQEAEAIANKYATLGLETFRGTVPDEPCVAIAMSRSGVGTVLPETSDFMNTPVGAVGDIEIDVLKNRCRFIKHSMHDVRLIQPAILHAGKYVNNMIYWKQLDRLAELERYAEQHPYGYMPPAAKWRRSIERRILKLRKKL